MLLNLLSPNRCLHCNRIINGQELVCELCFDQIRFTHHHFSETNLLKEKCSLLFPVENAFALMQFEEESLSRKIVHQLKYSSREKAGKTIAEWVTERLDFGKEKPDLMISVPLHPKKLKERGYNQLHLFTETLSENFKIPYDHDLIKRNFYKKAQALKDKKHRTETENLFSIAKNIKNKHVLIIDDVFTTGNTMSSVAWEILKAGNNKVSVLVMAVD
ncbi:MAG: ComF family protein [Weeksellaceae bacterium]|nr:ComF family protein [Bacteroidota bacterium]MCG2780853.1 ComF family protein [Weeksellaceae bacterium]